MKGIVLAGGLGRRLGALTRITNKHLLPVYDRPMVFYPIQKLAEAGIRDIMLVTGGNNAGDFLRLLGNGNEFGLKHIHYTYQRGEGGIAEALGLCEDFAQGEKIVVILGDNVFQAPLEPYIERFQKQPQGARLLIKRADNPQRFGVVRFKERRIDGIVEKPHRPPSSYIVTGIYMYDQRVFRIIKGLTPSARGELEITDVNNTYLKEGFLEFDILKGWWTDCGTAESLFAANRLVAGHRKKIPAVRSKG